MSTETKPDYTSVCELVSFYAKTPHEALQKAADYMEEHRIDDPTNLSFDQREDGDWVVAFVADYIGNTSLRQIAPPPTP